MSKWGSVGDKPLDEETRFRPGLYNHCDNVADDNMMIMMMHVKLRWIWVVQIDDDVVMSIMMTMWNSMQSKYVAVLCGDPMLLHMVAPVIDQGRNLILSWAIDPKADLENDGERLNKDA